MSYSLPDDQCRRLVRHEMDDIRMLLAGLMTIGYSREGLQQVFDMVPGGHERFNQVLAPLEDFCADVVGVINKKQCLHIHNTMKDFEMRLVPKLTPLSLNVIMTAEEVKQLIECARWQCKDCVEDAESCQKCKLYQLLTGFIPLDDDGERFVCPYGDAEWKD